MIGRPRVRVNQLGYVPDRPKRATWISDAEDSVPFAVLDQSGSVIYTKELTICSGGTLSVRATSPVTAATTAHTSELGSSGTTSIQHCRRHRVPSLEARPPARVWIFPTIPACWACRPNAVTSTTRPPK